MGASLHKEALGPAPTRRWDRQWARQKGKNPAEEAEPQAPDAGPHMTLPDLATPHPSSSTGTQFFPGVPAGCTGLQS